jgi:hypothetical protein
MNRLNEIFLKSKTVSERSNRGYRIYTDKNNFQFVEAPTVAEAIEKSGIKDPVRIDISGVITKCIFTQAELAEKQAAQSQPASAVIPPQTPPATNTPDAVTSSPA